MALLDVPDWLARLAFDLPRFIRVPVVGATFGLASVAVAVTASLFASTIVLGNPALAKLFHITDDFMKRLVPFADYATTKVRCTRPYTAPRPSPAPPPPQLLVKFLVQSSVAVVVPVLMSELRCVDDGDGDLVLAADPEVHCFVGGHLARSIVAGVLLAIYVLPSTILSAFFIESRDVDPGTIAYATVFEVARTVVAVVLCGVSVFLDDAPAVAVTVQIAGLAGLQYLARSKSFLRDGPFATVRVWGEEPRHGSPPPPPPP